jgi:hypothetical protein
MSDTGNGPGVEPLLRELFSPVEPPDDLSTRVMVRLQSISEHAAGELEGWELAAMRDPRNWVRPALALLGGSTAGVGLVLLRIHQRHRNRHVDDRRGTQPDADASN